MTRKKGRRQEREKKKQEKTTPYEKKTKIKGRETKETRKMNVHQR